MMERHPLSRPKKSGRDRAALSKAFKMPIELLGLRLSKPHRPEKAVANNSVSRQTVVAFVCQNGISSSRTDYAIDRAAVISSARESLLNANHD
jgi:hypothetical protein